MSRVKISKVSKKAYPVFALGAVLLVNYDLEITKDGHSFEISSLTFEPAECETVVLWLLTRLSDKHRTNFNSIVRTALMEDLKPDLYSLYHNGQLVD